MEMEGPLKTSDDKRKRSSSDHSQISGWLALALVFNDAVTVGRRSAGRRRPLISSTPKKNPKNMKEKEARR